MNKKAFTLVELLAVIIIIGLIAVITLPKISDSLENSKKNLSTTSAQGYAKTIDEYILKKQMNKEKIILNGDYNINENGDLFNESNEYELEYKGKKPTNGTLTYIDNELQSGCITINKYKVTIENGEVINTEKGTCQYERILTRVEKIPQLTSNYISAVEEANITVSGIYSVNELNNQINYEGELPTDGWIAIVYDEINGNWVWKYSIKYKENEVISYNGTSQSSSTQLESQPVITLIAGTDGKTAGDEIAIDTERFYVLENTGTKLITLAKANLNIGNMKDNNLIEGRQGTKGRIYGVPFSATAFWVDFEATASPYLKPEYRIGTTSDANIYDPINYSGAPGENNYSIAYYVINYINYLNNTYPSLNVTGRLLTKDEYANYKTNYQSLLVSQEFWLGTGGTSKSNDVIKGVIYTKTTSATQFSPETSGRGVRPVIEIDTSKI